MNNYNNYYYIINQSMNIIYNIFILKNLKLVYGNYVFINLLKIIEKGLEKYINLYYYLLLFYFLYIVIFIL